MRPMRFAFLADLSCAGLIGPDMLTPQYVELKYLEIDLSKLIDDYAYINKLLDIHYEDFKNSSSTLLSMHEYIYQIYKGIKEKSIGATILRGLLIDALSSILRMNESIKKEENYL